MLFRISFKRHFCLAYFCLLLTSQVNEFCVLFPPVHSRGLPSHFWVLTALGLSTCVASGGPEVSERFTQWTHTEYGSLVCWVLKCHLFICWPYRVAHGIFLPRPGIEPEPLASERAES